MHAVPYFVKRKVLLTSSSSVCGNSFRYYDLKVGNGAEAVKGSRVAVRSWLSYIFNF